MLSRAFNVIGLIVSIAGLKASLLGFAAKKSALAILAYFIAGVVAIIGIAILVGAGYVALEAVFGVSIAMAIVGVFLLLAATLIWAVARQRGNDNDDSLTEDETRRRIDRHEDELRAKFGMTDDKDKTDLNRTGAHMDSSTQSKTNKGIKDPKVAIAAGFAMFSLLGPGKLFRTVKIAAGAASVAAMAKRAINDNTTNNGRKDSHGHATRAAPTASSTPYRGPNTADDLSSASPSSPGARGHARHTEESEHAHEAALR